MDRLYLTMDEIHGYLLETLIEFDAVCREHNLRYSLVGGTLLGAIRHRGFIPWDDDVDVMMPRPDYEILMNLYGDKSINGFSVVTSRNSKLPIAFAKFCNNKIWVNTYAYEDLTNERLWVDVFPVDGTPPQLKGFKKNVRKREALLSIAYCHTRKSKSLSTRLVKALIRFFTKPFLGPSQCVRKVEQIGLANPFESSEMVSLVVFSGDENRWYFPRRYFEELKEVQFEAQSFYALSHWEECLEQAYGDFMALPPESERANHSIEAWVEESGDSICVCN